MDKENNAVLENETDVVEEQDVVPAEPTEEPAVPAKRKLTNKDWQFDASDFGPFLIYLTNPHITDIIWNGRALWIDDITCGRYMVPGAEEDFTDAFIDDFSARVANYAKVNFNPSHPLLEAQIDIYRLSILNKYVVHTGTSVAIRRTSTVCQLNKTDAIATGFCSEEIWDFLPKIIKSGISCIAGGLPGVGKTELAKLLSMYIPPHERALVMEDSPEFHYAIINPKSDCTEVQITDKMTYELALKASLRQRPEWNILAEARGRETQYLMENFSSGIKVLTTTHIAKEEDLIPRLRNMIGDSLAAEQIENEIYLRGLCVFVVKREIKEKQIHRHLHQICFYSRENGMPTKTLVLDNGKIVCRELPPNILQRFVDAGFEDPLNSKKNHK